MVNRMKKIVITLVASLALVMGTTGPVEAMGPPKVTVTYAKQMNCKPRTWMVTSGPANSGVACKVDGYEFWILKYNNPTKAVKWWKAWIDKGYFVRKGRVLVIPGADENKPFLLKKARYAAKRIDGRVVKG